MPTTESKPQAPQGDSWPAGSGALLLAMIALPLLASGCKSYAPRPLPDRPSLSATVPAFTKPTAPPQPPGTIVADPSPANDLDLAGAALLAIANNGALRAARAAVGVAEAQLTAARLFADPQLSVGADHPATKAPFLVDGLSFGLGYDLGSLIVRGPAIDAARAERERVRLGIIWQEWLTASQARQLFVRTLALRDQADIKRLEVDLYDDQYRRLSVALGEGGVSSVAAATALASLRDASRQLGDLQRQAERAGRDLRLVLGLMPEASLALRPARIDMLSPMDFATARRGYADLPARRPDLLALAAGYRAQEATVRRAIVAQFPAFSIGIRRARDTSGVDTVGFSATITLPVFNRNRGDIAISEATRERLYQEYQARLDAAVSDADALVADGQLLERQLGIALGSLPELEATAAAARAAMQRGDIDGFTYVGLEITANAKRLEVAQLRQALLEQRIVLQTLLAGDPPAATSTAPGISK